ncbi:MAG: hypothetical protein LBE74_04730 [Treponema sp.]|nr:hypothetical protein [Treponema sp.]
MKPLTFIRVKRKLIRTFFREQWSLLLFSGGKENFLGTVKENGRLLKKITPPRDFQWADPFIVEWNGKTYIFVEQQYKHENGTLGYIELFADYSTQLNSTQRLSRFWKSPIIFRFRIFFAMKTTGI